MGEALAVCRELEAEAQCGSWAVPFLPPDANPKHLRKTAELVTYPKATFPAVADYAKRCAALIRETFPAPSQHQMCIAAARMTGASPDTFDRILAGDTKSPDARLMLTILAIRAATGKGDFPLGDGFSVRIILGGQS